MKIRFLTNWRNRKAGETVEVSGSEAVTALRDRAAVPVAGKPVDRAEKRPSHSAERC
jgi:hypothetical protein